MSPAPPRGRSSSRRPPSGSRRPAPGSRRSGSGSRRSRGARRRNQRSDLVGRIIAAIPAIAFALFIVIEGGLIFAAGLIALGLVCLHELYGMLDEAAPVRLAGMLALIGLVLAANFGTQYQILLVAMVFVPVLFVVSLAQLRAGTVGMSITLLGVWWIGLALAHAMLLRRLPHGDGIVIDILVGTFVGDTGAYLGGRSFGRRPLAPRLSPSKTVEGLLVGMVCAVVAVWFSSIYEDWLPSGQAVLLGIGVAIAAPIGDLFESFIKRDAHTKDTGRFFGAHGGALDRLDAVMFSAVTGYYIWHAML